MVILANGRTTTTVIIIFLFSYFLPSLLNLQHIFSQSDFFFFSFLHISYHLYFISCTTWKKKKNDGTFFSWFHHQLPSKQGHSCFFFPLYNVLQFNSILSEFFSLCPFLLNLSRIFWFSSTHCTYINTGGGMGVEKKALIWDQGWTGCDWMTMMMISPPRCLDRLKLTPSRWFGRSSWWEFAAPSLCILMGRGWLNSLSDA